MRVTMHVGHPGYDESPRFDTTLQSLPRVGEFIRAERVGFQHLGRADADLWQVLAVVHESPDAEAEATLHVLPADMRDIFDLFEGDRTE
jgi:hypothetical protein